MKTASEFPLRLAAGFEPDPRPIAVLAALGLDALPAGGKAAPAEQAALLLAPPEAVVAEGWAPDQELLLGADRRT